MGTEKKISFSKSVKCEIEKQDSAVFAAMCRRENTQEAAEARLYVRRRFLEAGSVTDPQKDYHMEFVCENAADANRIQDTLLMFQLDAKIMERNGRIVAYLKDAAQISDVLSLIGAVDGLMAFENVRILREVSEKVNRRVNCETANLQRTVSAGIRQVADIELIRDTIGLGKLDPGLREIAEARLEDPNASLQELAAGLSEPIGKSGANHRMRRIAGIAEAIREKCIMQRENNL